MKVKLKVLSFELGDSYIQENDVVVSFSYEALSNSEIRFSLSAHAGQTESLYRFQLNLVYMIDIENMIFDTEDALIENCINAIIPSFSELIIAIDPIVRQEDERH